MTGTFVPTPSEADARSTLTASGESLMAAMEAGLRGLLAAVRTDGAAPTNPGVGSEQAVAINAEGADGPALFAGLAADVLAQLETYGTTFDRVELDGLIRTDGGLSAWGYLRGIPGQQPRSIDLQLAGVPTIATVDGREVITWQLRRAEESIKESDRK